MKRLLQLGSFSETYKLGEMTRREKALQKRINELSNQISNARRTSDREEAQELEEYQQEVQIQLDEVQRILRTADNQQRGVLYQAFFLKHGKEEVTKP